MDDHWESSCGLQRKQNKTKTMEKIQERALKFIYNENHSTYEELPAKSKLPSLKIRRIRTIAIETFKIINKETPQYLHDLITLKNNKYSFRYSNTAHIPTVKTTRCIRLDGPAARCSGRPKLPRQKRFGTLSLGYLFRC